MDTHKSFRTRKELDKKPSLRRYDIAKRFTLTIHNRKASIPIIKKKYNDKKKLKLSIFSGKNSNNNYLPRNNRSKNLVQPFTFSSSFKSSENTNDSRIRDESRNSKLNIYNNHNNCQNANYSLYINISSNLVHKSKKKEKRDYSDTASIKSKYMPLPIYHKKKAGMMRSSSTVIKKKLDFNDENDSFLTSDLKKVENKTEINERKCKSTLFLGFNRSSLSKIIVLQSFVRGFLLRIKKFKIISRYYKYDFGIKHIKKVFESTKRKYYYFKLFIKNTLILKQKRKNKQKKNQKPKKLFVSREQYEFLKVLRQRNIHNINDFKKFIVWCMNNNITSI